MSDYLSNLVGKALNRLPVVRPQHAPLFAPTPYVEGALGASPLPTPAPEVREEETSPGAAADAREYVPTDRRDFDATRSHGPRSRERSGATEEDDASHTPPTFTPRRRREEPSTHGALTPHVAPRTASEPRTFPPRGRDETAGRQSQHDDEPAESLAPARDAARATAGALADLRRRVNRDEAGADELERELARLRAGVRGLFGSDPSRAHTPPPSSAAVADAAHQARRRDDSREDSAAHPTPRIRPRDAAPATPLNPAAPAPRLHAPAHADAAPAPEPTIQVTIGRIEVRAAQQPAPSRRSSAHAPRQSLEEYLQRRSGGGR